MPLTVLSALADPTRLGAMRILWDGGEHCVCELMTRLDASQSRMSRHMAILKSAGLVTARRDAQWVRYRIRGDVPRDIANLLAAVMAAAAAEPESRAA